MMYDGYAAATSSWLADEEEAVSLAPSKANKICPPAAARKFRSYQLISNNQGVKTRGFYCGLCLRPFLEWKQ